MFEITKWRLYYYCCYLFSNNFAWNARDSNDAARAALGIYIMRRIMCALGRMFFFSHEKSERWFAIEAKEKELRRSRPRWSRDRTSKNSRKLTEIQRERELGCTAMHEIPLYDEKRGYASLRNEIISLLSALSRDGSFTSRRYLEFSRKLS